LLKFINDGGVKVKDTKIVFLDLDGTLKDEDKKISTRSRRILKRLTDIGVQIVLTTGRPLFYTIALSKQLGISSYVISSNGAEIYNYTTNKVIYNSKISKEDILKIDELVKKHELYFVVNSLLNSYTNKTFDEPGKKVINSLEEIIDETISQIIIESYDIDKMKIFRSEMSKFGTLKISNKSRKPDPSKQILFYDVTNIDVSKGFALRKLCEYLNIDIAKTMAIGDSDNDIEMLKAVDVKVAMENGTENLKKEASHITLSNNEDGVAVMLEKLYDELVK